MDLLLRYTKPFMMLDNWSWTSAGTLGSMNLERPSMNFLTSKSWSMF